MAEYLTVSALTQYLKRKFTQDPYLAHIYVTGEVSNFRRRPTHQYFSLKDEHAVINATMFKRDFAKLPFDLEAGMKVNAYGHVDLYAPNGSYSLIIEKLEPDGIGALYQAYEQLKARLQKAGVFNQLQRPIPRFPKKIAVITSPSGAVIRDILTTVKRRYPIAEVDLYPAAVQGAQAVPELIKRLDQVATTSDADVLIIGRGGGSIEDLWAFNDEKLANKLLTMPMPVISSVGHETDTTIADYVADQRAATPTAAAELATPVPLADLWLGIEQLRQRLVHVLQGQISQDRDKLQHLQQSYVLQDPRRLYEGYAQRIDLASAQLQRMMAKGLAPDQQRFDLLAPRLPVAMKSMLEHKKQTLRQAVSGLQLVSPLAVLSRGYGLVEQKGQLIRSIQDVSLTEPLTIELADGQIEATVVEKREKNDGK
ncbi:exodeoxyribonuclease VII large subunit [Weissella halotolerans]|uniref:Exodeoxyribonuclease 7 large subunit n=1 Tax=Weissella halotolerans DSM 20190 TaxID=1123500 RepID=A0A0R2FW53_9LACO|nr:exodeoxyribonuclease VII large subunit [Weissella halotolerans]KRN32545.1 exodeoxyribonuclease VII large subunit [Weissella halotolerans DSM 20190]